MFLSKVVKLLYLQFVKKIHLAKVGEGDEKKSSSVRRLFHQLDKR